MSLTYREHEEDGPANVPRSDIRYHSDVDELLGWIGGEKEKNKSMRDFMCVICRRHS